jgi:hypothetical protein
VKIQHARTAIATGTCLTFGLATAVAVGAVPQATGSDPATKAVSVAATHLELARLLLNPDLVLPRDAATPVRRVMHASRPHVVVTASTTLSRAKHHARVAKSAPVSSVTVEPAAAQAPEAKTANIMQAPAKHKKHHHKKKHHHHKKAHKPAKPVLAARTTPSASAVSKAISGLRNFVHTPLTPSSGQVAQFGDAVCTAFDDGKTFSQVKAEILAQVKKLPFTTVTAGAADYVVTTAVSLYCPGYQSKVS